MRPSNASEFTCGASLNYSTKLLCGAASYNSSLGGVQISLWVRALVNSFSHVNEGFDDVDGMCLVVALAIQYFLNQWQRRFSDDDQLVRGSALVL
jgi:hypothetical protein